MIFIIFGHDLLNWNIFLFFIKKRGSLNSRDVWPLGLFSHSHLFYIKKYKKKKMKCHIEGLLSI
jgi:hypothetical protein